MVVDHRGCSDPVLASCAVVDAQAPELGSEAILSPIATHPAGASGLRRR